MIIVLSLGEYAAVKADRTNLFARTIDDLKHKIDDVEYQVHKGANE